MTSLEIENARKIEALRRGNEVAGLIVVTVLFGLAALASAISVLAVVLR